MYNMYNGLHYVGWYVFITVLMKLIIICVGLYYVVHEYYIIITQYTTYGMECRIVN